MVRGDSEASFEIRSINSQAGLYFEEIGKMRLFHEDWKLVTYLNLTIFQEEYDHLIAIVNKMRGMCEELVDHPVLTPGRDVNCGSILGQIEVMVKEMDEYNVRWFVGKGRSKRGLLNIVGSVSKALFGTLDEGDAERYLEKFKTLNDNNKIRDRIDNEHTSLIQSLTNIMNKNEEHRTNQTITLSRQIDIIESAFKALKADYMPYMVLKLKLQIRDMTSYVTLLLVSYLSKQKQFLESVAVGQKSPNSPSLIPPQMFLEELEKIRQEVTARDLDFPLEPKTETLSTFYLISTPEARILNDQLIISFTLPLVATVEYILYKVSPLPYRIRENLFGYIVPKHEFVALDSFREKYVSIDPEELANCHHIVEKQLACKQTTPIMYAHSTKNCEINMLRMTNTTDNCDQRITNLTSELWIKLRQTNTYIYTFPEEKNVYIKCPRVLESRFLKGTGRISIRPNCQIKTDDVIIQGFKTTETGRMREIVPAVRLGAEMNETLDRALKLGDFHIENIMTPNIVNLGQKDRLQAISTGIDRVRFMENELKNQWSPKTIRRDIWRISGVILVVVIILGMVVMWLTVRKVRKVNRIRNTRTKGAAMELKKVEGSDIEGGEDVEETLEEGVRGEGVSSIAQIKRKVGLKWHP